MTKPQVTAREKGIWTKAHTHQQTYSLPDLYNRPTICLEIPMRRDRRRSQGRYARPRSCLALRRAFSTLPTDSTNSNS